MNLISTFNRTAGARVKRLREAAGMTQAELVDQLNARGHRFHTPSLVRVEQGRQPLRFEEAYDVALIFGVDTEALLRDTQDGERVAVQDQQRDALAQIASRRDRIAALEDELIELRREIAYYEMVVHHCEQRLADLTDDATANIGVS
jgi:transcriptional regulator with XRE-family HTH domain